MWSTFAVSSLDGPSRSWTNKLADVINSKRVCWTQLLRQCNADFEGSDDDFFGDGGEIESPRSIDLRPMSVLALVQRSFVVLISDNVGDKFRRPCVLLDHLSPFSSDFGC